jgi:hypothetical protein
MDLSDLPPSARDRIAAAEIEAEEIAERGGDLAKVAVARGKVPWVKPDDFHQTIFEVAGQDKIREGRKRAAMHLFGVTADEYLKAGRLDIEQFSAKLDAIGTWVCERFHAVDGWIPVAKRQCLALAYRTRAAALEAGETSKGTIIAKLPAEALIRMEAATAAFMAEYLPKLEREANKSGPIHDAELLRDFVTHQFNLVARECMAVCASVEEFEAGLHSDIARFVRYGISQYRWLAEPMRKELDSGFTFLVTRANPWAAIPETERASVWHVGAITGEALTHAALKLRAEAWARAADGFPKVDLAGDTKPGGTEPAQGKPAKVANGADGGASNWQAIEIFFLSDHRVQIRNGTTTETHNYGELGFADRRARQGKPNQAWVALRAMAEQNGIIRDGAKTNAEWPKVEKRIQEIRKALRKHFSITADPIPFVEGTGYQACFKIGCSPSFHT